MMEQETFIDDDNFLYGVPGDDYTELVEPPMEYRQSWWDRAQYAVKRWSRRLVIFGGGSAWLYEIIHLAVRR